MANNHTLTWLIERTCISKTPLTEETCNSIIDKEIKRDGPLLYYYQCPVCQQYHLTSSPPHETMKHIEVI